MLAREIKMPMSIFYMNVINDLVAAYCEANEDKRIEFEATEAYHKGKLGPLPFGNHIPKADKADYTEQQKEADRWLSNHAWPPPAPFKSILFPTKIWDWKKGAAGYAAHWRKEFLNSPTNKNLKTAARAAAKGDFVRLGKEEYVRLGIRKLMQLTIVDAMAEQDEVADVDLVKPLVQPTMKNVNADKRLKTMSEIVARSCRAKVIRGLLQEEVLEKERTIVRVRAKFRKRKRELKHERNTAMVTLCAAEDDLAATKQRAAALYKQVQQLKKIAPPAKLNKLRLQDIGPLSESEENEDEEEEETAADNTEQQQDNVPESFIVPPIVKEEHIDEQFRLADLEKEIQALAKRLSLLFRIENDVFVLMLPTEEGDQWLSRLLMLRDDNCSIRLAEFTGSSEAFAEKAEHWLKSDFHGKQQLMNALNAKCVEYFQQQKMAKEEDN